MIAPVPKPMLLREFAALHYRSIGSYPKGTPKRPSIAVQEKLTTTINHLRDAIGREPRVDDLTDANRRALKRHLDGRVQPGSVYSIDEFFMSLWRQAADAGLVPALATRSNGGRPAGGWSINDLTDEPGTLWHICQTQYFKKNIRIRSHKTRISYRTVLRDFAEFLGHNPTPADLSDDNVVGMMHMGLEKGRSPVTCNERQSKLVALWNWMAKRRMVEYFPAVQRARVPKRQPRAWTPDELQRLIAACRAIGGGIDNGTDMISRPAWWVSLHFVLWDTGARIGELLQARWSGLNVETGQLDVAAELRKCSEADVSYFLSKETLEVLLRIRRPSNALIFGGWYRDKSNIYYTYHKILKRAGLPRNRTGFHKMRRSVASYLHAAGYNATDALHHASADVTRKHYLDPNVIGAVQPAKVLFRLDGSQPNGGAYRPDADDRADQRKGGAA